ncbi:MAG: serine hydrolase [Lachnospiraceae bacterium]|nr:serine hydrolase [Lachnospiraceae bacterium]
MILRKKTGEGNKAGRKRWLVWLLVLCVWMTAFPVWAIDASDAGNPDPAAAGTQGADQGQTGAAGQGLPADPCQSDSQTGTAGEDQKTDQSQPAEQTLTPAAAQTVSAGSTAGTKTTANSKRFRKLEKKLNAVLSTYGGTWSVYVKNLKTGESLTINNKKMYAASLIKLFAMAGAYDRVYAKKLALSSVSGLLNIMITVSDNDSFNTIVRKIGKKRLNKWIRKNGFKKTEVVHDVGLAANSTIVRDGRKGNTTTVRDCGKLLEMIYRGKCVSKKYSKLMAGLLKRQTRRSKIPAGIPAGVVVANKTGETDETCHDAAIVYAKKAPYILVVMVTDPGAAWTHDSQIADISRIVYQAIKKK